MVSRRIGGIRQVLGLARYTIQPGPRRLAGLEDLLSGRRRKVFLGPALIMAAC
jgi:hypothetical protein